MTVSLIVVDSTVLCDEVREVVLARSDGGVLPSHPPGSHLRIDCGGSRNAYSLTNSGDCPTAYAVAVLRRPNGAGSVWMHRLRQGDTVLASGPHSAFAPVRAARKHLLVAGGIGVTPMLAHAKDAVRWGVDVELRYVARPGAAAYLDVLSDLLGSRLVHHRHRDEFIASLTHALGRQPIGAHLYVCGPAGLTDSVIATAADLGWPEQRVHVERFVPTDLDPGQAFSVRLPGTGRHVPIPAGVSLLDGLLAAGVAVPNMCRSGVCGECRIPVRAGRPLHRDEYLSADERAAGDSVMACVSRSETEILEVDL